MLTPHDYRLFPMIAAAYVGFALVGGALDFADGYLSTWIGERFLVDLRTRTFAHLQDLSLSFFERRQLGDIMSRLTGDVSAVEGLVLAGLAQLVSYVSGFSCSARRCSSWTGASRRPRWWARRCSSAWPGTSPADSRTPRA